MWVLRPASSLSTVCRKPIRYWGVDMASTGEVGCIGTDTSCAVLKAMLSVGYRIPEKSVLLSTGNAKQKADTLEAARMLQKKG